MAPLGKFTLSVIGLRLFGAAGFFWGMFLGHLLIDHSLVGKWIENRLSELDDNVRLLLPYGFYKYYSRLDDNLFGKVWGALLGAAAFGWGGFITLFILGHILFDVRGNALVKDAKKGFEHFWNRHWGKIFGFILGFSLHSRIVLFAGIIIGFFADLYRLEGSWRSKLKINRLLGFWARINPLKLALHSAEARKVSLIQSMAGLSAKVAKADRSAKTKSALSKRFLTLPPAATTNSPAFSTKPNKLPTTSNPMHFSCACWPKTTSTCRKASLKTYSKSPWPTVVSATPNSALSVR